MWLVTIVNGCYQDLTVCWVFPQLTAHAGGIKTKHSVNRLISGVKKPHWNLSCQRNDTETFETFWLLYNHKLEHAKHKHIRFITHRNTYMHKMLTWILKDYMVNRLCLYQSGIGKTPKIACSEESLLLLISR